MLDSKHKAVRNNSTVGNLFFSGWGKIRHPGSMHNILQQAKMPVVSKQTCTDLNTKKVGVKVSIKFSETFIFVLSIAMKRNMVYHALFEANIHE